MRIAVAVEVVVGGLDDIVLLEIVLATPRAALRAGGLQRLGQLAERNRFLRVIRSEGGLWVWMWLARGGCFLFLVFFIRRCGRVGGRPGAGRVPVAASLWGVERVVGGP